MSEVPQGPGWWKASDGRWYPPSALPAQPYEAAEPLPWSVPEASAAGEKPKKRRMSIWGGIAAALVLVVGGAVAAVVTLSGPNPQPVSVLVVDATGVANPVPASFSLAVGSNPQCYPVFSSGKAVCKFTSAVLAGQQMSVHLTGVSPAVLTIRVPHSANVVAQTALLTIHNKSMELSGFGRSTSKPRPDPFADEVAGLNATTTADRQKYEDPIFNAYTAVFSGNQTAPRINIYNAINPLVPLVKQGDAAVQGLSSRNPVIEKWIGQVQACWDARVNSWQAEANADNVNDPVAGADAANQAATTQEQNACQAMNDGWTSLDEQAQAA